MKKLIFYPAAFLFSFASFFSTCNKEAEETFSEEQEVYHGNQNIENIEEAVAVLHPAGGNKVKGIVKFKRDGDEIKVTADIEGLTPGKHGFHIHEFGDCSSPDAESAGGHFNPAGHPHGELESDSSHAGDLGNIEADENGKAHLEWSDSKLSFKGNSSIIGRAVVVHQKEDDLTSQPSGNAGGRVACGVVGAVSKK